MERDRKQIAKLVYLIVPIVLLWSGFGASFCYELGKNGLGNIDWFWVFQTNLPVLIITIALLFYGQKKWAIFKRK